MEMTLAGRRACRVNVADTRRVPSLRAKQSAPGDGRTWMCFAVVWLSAAACARAEETASLVGNASFETTVE